MEELHAEIRGIRELFNEKFEDNKRDHQAVWEQVKMTNGRVRWLEKAVWSLGGALAILGIIFSSPALTVLANLIK